MPQILVRPPMAKKKAKTASARIDEELLQKANAVAVLRNISTPDYLNSILAPIIESDYDSEIEKAAKRRTERKGGDA